MYKKKESTREKKKQEAIDNWGEFIVMEVERAVTLTDVQDCLIMFKEWDMEIHEKVLKQIYL